jgi:hypothetical protein
MGFRSQLYHSKKTGNRRPVLNLSATQLVHRSQAFQDGISQNRLHSINQENYPTSIDLADVVLHVLVHHSSSLPLVHMGRPAVSIPATPIRSVSFTSRFRQNSSQFGTTERDTARI